MFFWTAQYKHDARASVFGLRCSLVFASCWYFVLSLAVAALAQDTGLDDALAEAVKTDDYSSIIKLTEGADDVKAPNGILRANAFQQRGQNRFFAAKIAESISDVDA